MDIKEMNFSEAMVKLIEETSEVFEEISKVEGTKNTLINWIETNLEEGNLTGILEAFTEREKFLYAFGLIQGLIAERYMEG